MTQNELIIDGQKFVHVKTRAYTPISVYKGVGSFLRIGDRAELEPELRHHEHLITLGFPVPKIIKEGESDGQFYYVEESFGEDHLGALHAQEFKSLGKISNQSFQTLLEVSKKFAEAQLKTAVKSDWKDDYYELTHTDWMIDELPDSKDMILEAFEKCTTRLAGLPSVVTHGDFNPWNMFPQGVIDVEKLNKAPAGYDLVSNIYHMWVFPKGEDYEMTRSFQFSEKQVAHYLQEMDRIFTENDLLPVSDYQDELFLGRMTWSAARMQRWPNIQQWRYELFVSLIQTYLDGGSVVDQLIKN